MDDPNITMEEYIRLEEEKVQSRGETFNWQTATFGRIRHYYEEESFTNFEAKFSAIIFGNTNTTLSDTKQGMIMGEYDAERENSEIEFLAIVLNNTSMFDATPSYEPTVSPPDENKIDFRISLDESDDEDYMVIFYENSFSYKIISVSDLKTDSENDTNNMPSSPKPTIDYLDDLDCFNEFENEFPAILYNDGLTSKPDLEIESPISSEHINEFETSVHEYDEDEQNVLYFNDLFPFDIIRPDDLKLEKDNDDNDIDIIQSSRANEITHGSNMLSETSHDKITKTFRTGSFVIKVKIVIWNYYANEMLFFLIMNLYVPFGILFDPKRYYKDGIYALMLRRPRSIRHMASLPPADQRHPWLRMSDTVMDLDTADTLCFQLGGAGSEKLIPDKGDLRDYWVEISSDRDFLGPALFMFSFETLKSGARLSRGYFIGHLTAHFGLVDNQGLRGLQVVIHELLLIDLHELGRLNIYTRYGDTWAWVALRPKRQQAVTAGAHEGDEGGPTVEEAAREIPAPAQEPPPPPPVPQPRTMS
ncbi:hypothetical protein Tco_0219195 [Tanacetum coccineum]